MILLVLTLACGIRLLYPFTLMGMSRWQISLITFIVPPLLLIVTTISIVSMGYDGKMLGLPSSRFSYSTSIIFLGIALVKFIKTTLQGCDSVKVIKNYPKQVINNYLVRIVEIDLPYSAQIGFWNPELIISSGLLKSLDLNHLKAVIAHEEAHKNYHDTFYFFWLGWLKTISSWLPNTNMIWEELLLLREIRADKEAIKNIDPLVLAESLIIVARKMNLVAKNNSTSFVEVCFHDMNTNSRLEKRIKALFEMSENLENNNSHINYLLLVLLPLLSIPFHN